MSDSHNILDEKDKQVLEYIEDVTKNADEIQRRVLTDILSINSDVEYLQGHGLNGCTDVSTFKKIIPFISYEELKPYITRIANGDNSPILCVKPITEFFISSGTSGGEQKLIPIYEEELNRRLLILSLGMPLIRQIFPGLSKGKSLYFRLAWPESKTTGGTIVQPLSTSLAKTSYFKNMSSVSYSCSIDIILCTDSYQSLYCQLLCGLSQNSEILRISTIFASLLIRVIKFLEDHWVLLANDIRTGTISPKITDPIVRESVMKILKPDSRLADFIESECSKGTWEGIIKRLWPNTKYIDTIVTGTMAQYIPIVDYYSNGLPLVSNFYCSSECFFGINLNPLSKPDDISYTLIPTMAYFEFLPVNRGNDFNNSARESEAKEKVDREFVDLVDVKLGQEYELVVTTYAGLYRYCIGDILRVTGFKNKAPQFKFVCRNDVGLSLHYEKTDEGEIHNATEKAVSLLTPFGAILIDYTSYAERSTTDVPGHYVLYWEISVKEVPSSIYEDCCHIVEESLNALYREARVNEKCIIGPLEIKIVEIGTFDKLMDQAMNHGASMSQYKTPRCVKSPHMVELLNSKVVSSHFSQRCPYWEPRRKHSLLSC